jgi:amidase
MKLAEYFEHDGLGLADLVRRREVSATELLTTAFSAVERHNPQLNAVVADFRTEAEAEIRRGLPEGPFTGVPFLIKDLGLAYAGKPTSMGSRLFARFVAPGDSELMTRYRRAGLVTLGKTNLPELGLAYTTEPALFGPCRNPWDLARTPGGSSGGSAAAVAARMVPMAHGNDAGGSIRVPASACGLFGFKPTRGCTPTGPFMGEMVFGLGVEHALTRSVRDSAALLDATAGEDLGPPYVGPAPARPYLAEVATPPGQLRIAVAAEAWSGVPVAAECREAVRDAAKLCEDLGHTVVEARPAVDWAMARPVLDGLLGTFAAQMVDGLAPRLGLRADASNLEAATLAMVTHGRALTAVGLGSLLAMRDGVARALGRFFNDHDVLLTPTLAGPPLPLGALGLEQPGMTAHELFDRQFAFAPFTGIFNLAGTPAMSVPLHWSPAGLPIGVHFAARFGADGLLFRLAGQLEQAAPWARRRPACVAQAG